jgi:hypothetical protein
MRVVTALVFAASLSSPAFADGWFPNEHSVEMGIRTGTTPSGSEYRIMPDKTASIAKNGEIWIASCKIDPINDEKSCAAYDVFERIVVSFKTTDRPVQICVNGHDFPGRNAFIRTDKNKAVETNEAGCVGGGYIAQMLKGKVVTSRIVKWPYDTFDDDTTNIAILKDALALVKFVRNL